MVLQCILVWQFWPEYTPGVNLIKLFLHNQHPHNLYTMDSSLNYAEQSFMKLAPGVTS
jgi:hypothetical protein